MAEKYVKVVQDMGAVLVCGLQKKCSLYKIEYCSSMRSTSYN